MTQYRYQLERYRGRSTRHVCPQCGRKNVFTRYVDTENNNIYISDIVGKCNRIDKCGYHYTPHQYFTDNPWKRDNSLREEKGFPSIQLHRKNGWMETPPPPKRVSAGLPRRVLDATMTENSAYLAWLESRFGSERALHVADEYYVGGIADRAVFWQVDGEGCIHTGKIMAYDEHTGKRLKGEGTVDWMHAVMRREGSLPEGWELVQCMYGEHLLGRYPDKVVAVAEGAKTAHIGAILMPEMVWVAVDSMMALTADMLRPLKGRSVILFPDEGKGYEVWRSKIGSIASEVGFQYHVSSFMEGREQGSDIADLLSMSC